MKKISPLVMIWSAITGSWIHRRSVLAAIALPVLLMFLVAYAPYLFDEELSTMGTLLMILIYVLFFSLFAVTCHRLVLAPAPLRPLKIDWHGRILRFTGYMLVLYTLVMIINLAVSIIYMNTMQFVASGESSSSSWLMDLFSIPALYVLARLSLVFPATAIDQRTSLQWSWNKTRGNGWRIFLVVGLFPWIMGLLIWGISREEASFVEMALLYIMTIFSLAVGIFALSLTYQAFMEQADDDPVSREGLADKEQDDS